jgi:signal transduction histidine kinase
MKFAAFIPLVGCICNFLLALLVLRSGYRNPACRVYFFWGMSIAVWNLGQYFLFTTDSANALFWARFCWFGVIFIPVLLFHISLLIAQIPVGKNHYIRTIYAISFVLAASNFTPFFVKGVRDLGSSGWYAIAGPALYAFNGMFTLVFVTIIILIRKRKSLHQLHRTRLDALIGAQIGLILLGTNDLLPTIGCDQYPFTNINVYPYGSLAAVLYGIVVAYSVLQHQLLDIRVKISHFVAQTIRFAFLFIIGLALLLTTTLIAPQQFTPFSFFSALAVILLSGIIASIYFPRLFGSGTEALERRILGDRFEYHDQIRSFIASMQMYTDTTLLLNDLHDLLLKTIGVKHYQIILLDDTSRAFSLFRAYPEQPVRQVLELKNDSPIFRFFENKENEYLAFNTAYATPGSPKLEREARNQLLKFEAEFCFPFFFEDEPFGLLLIGEKSNGVPYTITDLDLLVALTKNLSVIINQIRLKNQIQQAQEIELLGRMSHGMAHDLNNLLTPISTFLQLSSEGVTLQDLNEDLLPVSLRNIKTMRAYIREALFFSQNMRPDFQMGRLDVVVAQTVDIVRSKTEKSVDILVSNSGEILVEMDEVLIQRLLANIISNAVDASRLGSSIYIEIQRISKTEHGNEWLRVRVVDSGEGIRPEDLSKVFTPYFTTKNRGDHERGFGLGLAICRRIVHLHNGNLNITSQLGKGTTVQIDLPSRQTKTQTPITTNEQK